jgi:GTP 3',8-cyclase
MASGRTPSEASPQIPTRLPDRLGRGLNSLRISVIDRCDLRCRYCMPEEGYVWLPSSQILAFDEIVGLTAAFADLGVSRLRLTGGEPLLRGRLPRLVSMLSDVGGIDDLALTTNGTQLEQLADDLHEAGLHRVTVSLDSLQPERFASLTGRDVLMAVTRGLRRACDVGFQTVKINTVVMRGFNDDELVDMLDFARELGAELRFIEYMDVGGATHWTQSAVVPRQQILERLRQHYGEITAEPKQDNAPADRFVLPDGTRFGVIASVTEPFCSHCDRSRVTADGMWYTCLYANAGIDLRRVLSEQGHEAVVETVRSAWTGRSDRGAEERMQDPRRGVLYQVDELKQDPHREMHTRGG